MGDGWDRDRSGEKDAGSLADEAGCESGFEHVAADAGVFANDHLVAALILGAENTGHSAANAQGHLRSDGVFVGNPADTVCSK